jgi:tetratricopeptide (TPR) repeat protein
LEAEKAFLLQQRGALWFDSDREGSERDFQTSLEIYRRLGHRWHQAPVLNYLARLVFCQGNYREAISLLEESLAIYRDCDDIIGIATTQIILSNKYTAFGDFEKMDAFVHQQALRLRDLGSPALLAEYLMKDGINQAYLGRFTEAQKRMEAAFNIYEDLGDIRGRASTVELMGWIDTNLGFYDRAHERIQVSVALACQQGNKHLLAMGYMGLGIFDHIHGAHQQALQTFTESVSYYRQATSQDELGITLALLADVEYQLDSLQDASIHFREALQIAHQTGSWQTCVQVVGRAAFFATLQGDIETGVELNALATRYPYLGNSVFWEDTAGRHIAERAAELPEEVRAAAQARGVNRDLYDTVKELLEEFVPYS